MVNINKILITNINLSDDGYLPSLDLFDYYIFYNLNQFISISLKTSDICHELDDSGLHTKYNIQTFIESDIPSDIKEEVLNYLGFNSDVDELLDLISDPNIDLNRKFYLKSVIYYKHNQEGKPIFKHYLTIKNLDDLVHLFAEDFVNYEVLYNNNDFSKSKIIIETYLTEEEVKNKFKEFIINKKI